MSVTPLSVNMVAVDEPASFNDRLLAFLHEEDGVRSSAVA